MKLSESEILDWLTQFGEVMSEISVELFVGDILSAIPCQDSNPGHFELQSKSHDKLDRSAIAPLNMYNCLL